ncbi:MAG: proline dehydrogenase / delta 1-pyrroline-5-carboxylate dehydrogenase [Parcubacteria group bacterium Gr01-1014_70]|nr:MAG: proline dehydrogenase / delta 1-pyrroline-5-carboxylate dehydrogenase [Parcubacteria group bacterium Gr01-1014_70]
MGKVSVLNHWQMFSDFTAQYRSGHAKDPFVEIDNWNQFSLPTQISSSFTEVELSIIHNYAFITDPERVPAARNFINGEWILSPEQNKAFMLAHFDQTRSLFSVSAPTPADIEEAIRSAFSTANMYPWCLDGIMYRKKVVERFALLMEHFQDKIEREIRLYIPKTKKEVGKDFHEAVGAARLLAGESLRALRGDMLPEIIQGQEYWKSYLPGGPTVIITPMNFVWGIPVIQLVAAYLAGNPIIFKGHPFTAISNEHIIRLLIAAGADPLALQVIQGFGKDVEQIAIDRRIKIVHITGSYETADHIRARRAGAHAGGALYNEGGGCNWAWIDDNFNNEELEQIAIRLVYSKLALSSHKCTTLHGIAASTETLNRLLPLIKWEMCNWKIADPHETDDDEEKIIGPLMVHSKKFYDEIIRQTTAAGYETEVVNVPGQEDEAYILKTQSVPPAIICCVGVPNFITVEWENEGQRTINLATTELFMPILVVYPSTFNDFIRFQITTNPYGGIATSIYTRDTKKISLAKSSVGGMLKINDGTDSAFEWEDFGGDGTGLSGNGSAGDPVATIRQYCRRQNGRSVVF